MTNKLHKKIMSMYMGRYETKNYFYKTEGHTDRVFYRKRGSAWDMWDCVQRDDNGHWHKVEY